MASRAQSLTLQYVAWNTNTNAGQTGDVANHTLRLVKNGTSAAPTNAASEVDAINAPGVYSLTITSSEATNDIVTLAGKSSTANVSIIPVTVTFEQLPTLSPGTASGGLPTLDANGDISAKWGAAAQAMALQITRGVKGTVWIVDPVNGNDSNAGTWASPFATPLPTASGGTHPASAGDVVLICGGTCSLGSSRYIMVAGVTLAGMGKEATTITSSILNAEIVKVASNCTVRDLSIKSTLAASANNFNYPIGANLATVNNVLLQRIATYADTDAFYFTGAGSTATIEDCTPHSNWDCVFASGAGTDIQILRTPIFTTASNAALPNSNSSVQAADGAFVRLIDCPIVNFSTNTNASRVTHVVHTGNSGTAGARVELIRSPILMVVDGSTQQTILADTGTTVVLENSPYDFTKTSGAGAITEQTNKSGLDFTNLNQATSATTLSNITVPTVTNLTNLPSIPANWLTASGIAAAALNGKGDWLLASGYTAPDNANIASLRADYTTARAAKLDDLDATISSRLAASSYVAPDNADIVTSLNDLVSLLARTDPATAVNAIKAVTDKLATTIQLNGDGPNYQFTQPALALAPAGGGGSGLSGPSSVTLTFVDASNNPVPNVEFTLVGVGSGRANSSGVATFGAQNGSYTVAAAVSGGTILFTNAALTVNGTTARTITGNAISFTIAPPGSTTVYLTTLDQTGTAKSGVVIQFQLKSPPANASGDAFDQTIKQVTSDINGLVQVALPIGCAFNYGTLKGVWNSDIVPSTGPYALKDVVGYYS